MINATEIKAKGKLFARSACWEYYVFDGVIYSIRADGTHFCIWCTMKEAPSHLHRLYQVIGKKFFTEDPDMRIIDPEFLRSITYA